MKKILLFASFIGCMASNSALAQTWTDLGASEQAGNHITKTAAFALYMQTAQDGQPCFSFIDDDSGPNNVNDFKVHLRKFNGTQWQDLGGASPNFPGNDFFPVAFDGNTPYVCYSEPFNAGATAGKTSVKKFNGTSWEQVGLVGFSAGSADANAIAISSSKIYVAYGDASVNNKITVMAIDKNNVAAGWQTVGGAGFSAGPTFGFVNSGINLVIDNEVPYVSYIDISLNSGQGALVIKKLNGNQWQDVGSNNPSNGHLAISANIRFAADHTPYIAYLDNTDSKGYLRSLVGNTWTTVGGQPMTDLITTNLSLAILGTTPFIALGTEGTPGGAPQIRVKSYRNGAWQNLGGSVITNSTSGVTNMVLGASTDNKLFLSYRNSAGAVYAKSFDVSSILPIQFKSITAKLQQQGALLQWTTGNETNNRLFELQHSIDGIHFSSIGNVLSNGNTTVGHSYSFVHALPTKGLNYYRIKQVDNDNTSSLSKIVTLDVYTMPEKVTLYPNPAKDLLHVQHGFSNLLEVTVKDIMGRTVKQLRYNTSATFDIAVNDLQPGIYFVALITETGTVTKQFLKQ